MFRNQIKKQFYLPLFAALILVLQVSACGAASAPPIATPTRHGGGWVLPAEPVLEAVEGIIVSEDDKLGELNIEYSPRMSPGSSDSMLASIYIPDSLVSLTPVEVTRVPIPSDAPRIIGVLGSFKTNILVASTMRVELTSTSFEVAAAKPAAQSVNISDIAKPTYWLWEIKAPETAGTHVLTMPIYRGEDVNPSWVGGIKIEVVEPTPTPAPTATPLPALTRIGNQLIDNSATIVTALIALVGVLAGVYATIQKDRRESAVKDLEQRTTKSSEEQKARDEEIARLRSIKWWQFWRK